MSRGALTEPLPTGPAPSSIGRQPVFDRDGKLWGYELFSVGSGETHVPADVLSSSYLCLRQFMDNGKKLIVDFSERGILESLPYALPPGVAVVRVRESACRRPGVVDLLITLKGDGYAILVADYSNDPAFEPIYRCADLIAVEVSDHDETTLAACFADAERFGASVMATKVKDHSRFSLCRGLGFALFHGAFFKAPDQVAARKLSSNEVTRLQLLQLIESDEPDLARLSEVILADVTVSFRLLAYLNSAVFAFAQRISSISHAIALLGWRNVKNWLRVVLLTDMGQGKSAHELVVLSAQRGLFLERLAREHDFWGFDPEKLNLVGTFSLLDALLKMPMPEIVALLPLDHKAKDALCQEPRSEYLPLLRLVQCLEEARWEDSEKLMQELNLDRVKVRSAFQAAIDWASQLESVPTS